MKVFTRAILPLGFKASGVASGIKKSGKLDLAIFYSDAPAKAACLFTANKIIAAPLKLDKIFLKRNKTFRAIIVNSGNANCYTGPAGLKDAEEVAKCASLILDTKKEGILVNSTGIIGKRLPIGRVKRSLLALCRGLSRSGIDKAKNAILTTDTFAKEITAKFPISGKTVTVCAVAKGAGMVSPEMATMLVFIFTDADITAGALKRALRLSTAASFNCISIDGCMSTNDSIMALANAAAKNRKIDKGGDFNSFVKALKFLCLRLAKMVVKDGEGATKFIQITVDKAKNAIEAKKAALAVANSNLFKAAMFGENPNFGRIVAAIGASGIDVEEDKLKIKVSSVKGKEINVYAAINKGDARSTVYTSDLTPEYVKINAEYN